MNGFLCPIPLSPTDFVQLSHGGAGRIAQRLLDNVFRPILGNPELNLKHDSATLDIPPGRLALTTDAFVVQPWRFPGGNIGSLAVHGTVNDLAMSGAKPIAMSLAFVIEEGFPVMALAEIAQAVKEATVRAGIFVAAADTKVVERGKGDGIYLSASGIGQVVSPLPILPSSVREGDAILLSGDVGRHGAAVMTVRDGLEVDPPIESDSAAVHEPVLAMLEVGIEVHCLRDVTRGGLATVLNEIAADGPAAVRIEEDKIPVREDVAAVCEILGLDPLYVACEGRFVAFVPADRSEQALEIMRRYDVSNGAVQIGLAEGTKGRVEMRGRIGVLRILDLLSGEQLPRIC
ncbi:MAG TPA: hydrogenase expression/formation protein HypE [Fimbriimonadaceae bacterium]|nr:hydrogenase expression/formation protein HypE [Fimbriimonadaceae bacterium]